MSFQIHALAMESFAPLFDMSDEQLENIHARRMVADAKPGYPCRVSLADAEIGEAVILVNFEHQSGDSPYRASHAIFVRENAEKAFPSVGAVPAALAGRLMSIRAFDVNDYMIASDVVDGRKLEEAIPVMLEDPAVAYLHLHNAKPGCYAARVTRA